jgi:hypothetical protein
VASAARPFSPPQPQKRKHVNGNFLTACRPVENLQCVIEMIPTVEALILSNRLIGMAST